MYIDRDGGGFIQRKIHLFECELETQTLNELNSLGHSNLSTSLSLESHRRQIVYNLHVNRSRDNTTTSLHRSHSQRDHS